jgi:hypothetical protein
VLSSVDEILTSLGPGMLIGKLVLGVQAADNIVRLRVLLFKSCAFPSLYAVIVIKLIMLYHRMMWMDAMALVW